MSYQHAEAGFEISPPASADATIRLKTANKPARNFTFTPCPEFPLIALFKIAGPLLWRLMPRQFGLPAQSQTLAELIRAAGFEAILYQSSKGPKRCLAIFPDQMLEESYVELSDEAPAEVHYPRLDSTSSTYLEGWDSVPRQLRNR